jgi:hypothetical protein
MTWASKCMTMALVFAVSVLAVALFVPSAAAAGSPWWHVDWVGEPSKIAPGGEGVIVVKAENIGTATAEGPETISDVLPEGFTVIESEGEPEVELFAFQIGEGKANINEFFHECTAVNRNVTCPVSVGAVERPFEYLEMRIHVKAEFASEPLTQPLNTAQLTERDGPPVSSTHTLHVEEGAPVFGVASFAMTPEDEGGIVDTRAGSHPEQVTTTLAMNAGVHPWQPPDLLRNLHFELPAGFLGNVNAVGRCDELDFQHVVEGGSANLCPSDSVIGAAVVTIDEPRNSKRITYPVPVFNLQPKAGEPARFGFELIKSPVILDTSVRTGGDYGVNVDVSNVTELASLVSSTVTLWGVPNASLHDESRGWGCLAGSYWQAQSGAPCIPSTETHPLPFLTMPTSCGVPFAPTVTATSWPDLEHPEGATTPAMGAPLEDAFGRPLSINGCNQLAFAPSIEVEPEVHRANNPTGLSVSVRMPHETEANGNGLASSAIRSATVTLPDGLDLNPAAAGGLEACSEAAVGFVARSEATGGSTFTPGVPVPFCPDASKVGSVKFTLPIISGPLEGAVYLATQNANPFGSLLALYVVAENPALGVRVKLAGEVQLGPSGQVTTSFIDTPQAPIEEAEFKFFGGPRAALGTPQLCGSYMTKATFVPWSAGAAAEPSSTFAINSGTDGGPCPSAQAFAPKLQAGSGNPNAGAFSTVSTRISRSDADQTLSTVQLRLPPGLAGMISSVTPCGEAEANAGTCGAQSLIGHDSALVGLGSEPYEVTGGQVFLTGPYHGAPFGLSIVTPAKAGPFDLGNVVVRARLDVDRRTAQVTVTTDALPQLIKGIPLDVKKIFVNVDRQSFTFNPTSCAPMSFSGPIQGAAGANALVSAPFQVANCANLKFDPKFTVSTSAHTSKAKGAQLVAKVAYPKTAQGSEANITKVKVALPKRLPSRLTTLQKACLAAVYAANPANCPAGSIVGHARVKTPVLPVPLTGPAYFVSHGNEAFPSLTIVLQGDNVTVELVGTTLIRNGITSTTFNAVPDVPFSEFELTLPQGPNSALAANGNLCQGSLLMPTEFFGQNGAVLKQSTKIAVTGCKKKSLTRKQKLAKALKACHKKNGAKRANCERAARRRFAAVKKKGRGGKK